MPLKRIVSILLLFVFEANPAFSQAKDTTKRRISISMNEVQFPINEFSIYADYCMDEKNSFGINVGVIYANPTFKVFILSPDQGTYPGTVWNGMVFRADYKHCWVNQLKKYWEVQVIYKTLSYHNQSFVNWIDDNPYDFSRNEKAYLIGLDAINGRHFLKYDSHLNLELFWGIGARYRKRNYSNLSTNVPFAYPLGSFTLEQFYPTLIFGFKVGFNCFLKK